MNNFFSPQDAFQKARLKLTLWYVLISILLLLIFSLAAIQAEKKAFAKIEQALGDPIQRPNLTALLERSLKGYEQDFRQGLFFFDMILLLAAFVLSYFLSGSTLKPIQTMLKEQEEFSADASHELRTPLATINMEIEALKRTEKSLPQYFKNVLDSIQQEVGRMSALVEGLLTLVREDDYQKTAKSFDFSQSIENILKQVTVIAEKKKIQITFDGPKKLIILGVEEKLKQIILIFLDNAIKYTPWAGKIHLSLKQDKGKIFFSVEDSGFGITPEDLPHIFERFYRGKTSAQNKTKGVGLGLSIAKKISANMGGKLSAESSPGKGSKFTLEFPSSS